MRCLDLKNRSYIGEMQYIFALKGVYKVDKTAKLVYTIKDKGEVRQ